ncbi:MAG: 4-(cytidine 5'-diphospho)-2-C-methyl-D-erythritol kinase [Erysipelotrichaceae bacterium]|nr:4-(cytidine 5'-diphospho)-2-C-methyl-D-erythritol kinase [Erysipelotrichaceae bacterium]
MRENAYAKVNLSLDVVSRKENGYHELSMIMVPLYFYDILTMEIALEMSFVSNIKYLTKDENNTVIKAIEVLRNEYKFQENFNISLTKHIPTQAGLAGGSADAAAAMRLVKRLLKLNISDSKMIDLAKLVGADVPFCIMNKPAMVSGIGEKLDFFKLNTDFNILLVKPKKGISTKIAFSQLDLNLCDHPDVNAMKNSLINNDYEGVIKNLKNSLEQPSLLLVPQIKEIKEDMLKLGMDGALMSGSGSTVFGITRDLDILEKANTYFREKKFFVRKTVVKK